MIRLLVVDDEMKIRQMIKKYAEYEGFAVDEAVNGLDAFNKCVLNDYDLIIMDVMMPELDGMEAVRMIKEKRPLMPVIMLTALGEEYDRVKGFEVGVDDYVVKPFSIKELMLRIKAILKRVNKEFEQDDVFVLEGLKIDFKARIVTIDDKRVSLSPKEYDLLVYFVRNQGIALTREQILATVWGYDFFGDDRTLDTHIKLLRKNMQEYSRYIVTLRGVGYRFEKTDES